MRLKLPTGLSLVMFGAIAFAIALMTSHPTVPGSEYALANRRSYLLRVPNASEPAQISDWNVAKVFRQIDSGFEQLAQGPAVFTAPDEMTVGETERVVARIARIGDDRDLLKGLPPGVVREWMQAHITPTMKASLTGADFDVRAETSEEQTVGGGRHTEWAWQVTPQISGKKQLTLRITAVVSVAGFEKPRDVVVTAKHVRVRVNASRWLMNFTEKHLDTALAVVLTAIFLGGGKKIWAAIRNRFWPNRPPESGG